MPGDLKNKVMKIVASGLPAEVQKELIEYVLLHPDKPVDEEIKKRRGTEKEDDPDS